MLPRLRARVCPADHAVREPQDEADDDHAGAVVGGALVEAGGDPAPLLEPVDAPLDQVAPPVADRVKGGWPAGTAVLVDPGRDGLGDATPTQQTPAGAGAVAPIGQQMRWPFPRPAMPTRPRDPDGVQQGQELRALVALPAGQPDRQRPAVSVHGQAQPGRQPAPAVPQRLIVCVRAPPLTLSERGWRRAPGRVLVGAEPLPALPAPRGPPRHPHETTSFAVRHCDRRPCAIQRR
jgi:hypothetical protein